LETAVLALPERCTLTVTGTPPLDSAGANRIRAAVQGKRVLFTGEVPETRRRALIAGSAMLISAQASRSRQSVPSVSDHFSPTLLLEALGCDTLPLASDAESNVEIMKAVRLSDLVFPAGEPGALGALIERVLAMPEADLARRKALARAHIRRSFLWDDYWFRVRRALALEASERPPVAAKAAMPSFRLSAASHAAGLTGFNWKVFQI
jgi:glycosyltransferase involved in cell wall biosynthesis